jgi:hypothetical protein
MTYRHIFIGSFSHFALLISSIVVDKAQVIFDFAWA